ncbi:nSTAND1 domain-containing NTPase, partial [Streptosporangium sp. G11]|uniref:NACHT and WD repeat domain-containing protein n=1 Tax=Streptosporangium sp. G11 TaxID=3436926 RepID=UPI003EBF5832
MATDDDAHRQRSEESESMRDGVRARVARIVTGTGRGLRKWSPPTLMAMLCAGALGPLLLPALGGSAVAAAAVGALTSVGGNILTDVVKAGIARVAKSGETPTAEQVEIVLEREIRDALQTGDERARELRQEISELVRTAGLVGAALEAAVRTGDRDLQSRMTDGLARLGADFDEFGFVLTEAAGELRRLRESVDEQNGVLQLAVDLQYRQATDTRLLMEQVAALERHARPRAGHAEATAAWKDCPYRGLLYFNEAEAAVFYGREVDTAQLVTAVSRRITDPGLLIVTGASGAGKSSLLRAGLMPAIARGELAEEARDWPRHVMDAPGNSPLARLSILLGAMANLDGAAIRDRLMAEPGQVRLLVRQAVEADAARRGVPAQAAPRLVLVVDQFEQVFSSPGDAAGEVAAFVAALHAAATPAAADEPAPALVIVAVRGDFVDRCADHPQLAAALAAPFIVGPLSPDGLRRAMTGPADAANLIIEPGLIDAILAELSTPDGGHSAGSLPLLSQAMLTTWEHREGNTLTSRGYGRTGGVTHAVATSAESAYTDLPAGGQDATRQIFRRLTLVSKDGALSRRTVRLPDLHAPDEGNASTAGRVIEAFAHRRLIVVDENSVQIAHDALLRSWPRLQSWLEADLADHALYSQLLLDAEDWRRNGAKMSYLYYGKRLADLRRVLPRWRADPRTYPPLEETQERFVHASIRYRVLALLLVGTMMTVLVGVVTYGWRQRGEALDRARVSNSQALAARSVQIADDDPRSAAQLALYANQINGTPESVQALIRAVEANQYVERHIQAGSGEVAEHSGSSGLPMTAVAVSRDGGTLVYFSEQGDKQVHVEDLRSGAEIRQFPSRVTRGGTLQLSADGRIAAWESKPNVVEVWDIGSGGLLRRLRAGNPSELSNAGDGLRALAFSADGRWLAAAYNTFYAPEKLDLALQVWDVRTGESVERRLMHSGRLEASFGRNGVLRVFDLDSGWLHTFDVRGAKTSQELRCQAARGWVRCDQAVASS